MRRCADVRKATKNELKSENIRRNYLQGDFRKENSIELSNVISFYQD